MVASMSCAAGHKNIKLKVDASQPRPGNCQDVVKHDLSFQISILSPSNSSGRPRSGFWTVQVDGGRVDPFQDLETEFGWVVSALRMFGN